MEVGEHLAMDRDSGGSGVDEVLEVAIRFLNHQVHVERDGRHLVDRPHDQRAERDVRHEVAVHHVEVQEVGAAALHALDFGCERPEISRE